jgi:hypothetical protein
MWPGSLTLTRSLIEGVMSSIIDAPDFTDVLTELRGNSTMQGTVTALYEIGRLIFANTSLEKSAN